MGLFEMLIYCRPVQSMELYTRDVINHTPENPPGSNYVAQTGWTLNDA